MNIKLKKELLEILDCFKSGLEDVKVCSGEAQSMTLRLEKAIEDLNSTVLITDVKFKQEGSGKSITYKVQ